MESFSFQTPSHLIRRIITGSPSNSSTTVTTAHTSCSVPTMKRLTLLHHFLMGGWSKPRPLRISCSKEVKGHAPTNKQLENQISSQRSDDSIYRRLKVMGETKHHQTKLTLPSLDNFWRLRAHHYSSIWM